MATNLRQSRGTSRASLLHARYLLGSASPAQKDFVRIRHPTAGEISQIGIPMTFFDTNPEIRYPPPVLGEHAEEALGKLLGYDGKRIAELRNEGVI